MRRECEVSIITVNYNGFADTCALIETIPANDPTLEVIVVDNGSTADEAALIANRYPHVRTLRSEKNLGFAGGNNIGIKAAYGKYLFLVNNDTVFKHFDIGLLTARLASSPTTGMVCPKIRFAWGDCPIQFAGYTPLSRITLRNRSIGYGERDDGQYDSPHPTPYAHGAAMMLKREVAERAGLMPECYFLYYEELDWSLRIREAGYDIWYDPGCTIFHKESRTTGVNSPLRAFYNSRNRLLFAKRNINGAAKVMAYCYLIMLVSLKDVLKHTLNRNPRQAAATIKGILNFLKSE